MEHDMSQRERNFASEQWRLQSNNYEQKTLSRILNLTLPPPRLRGIEMLISCTIGNLLVETFIIY